MFELPTIIVYSKANCPQCMMTKNVLENLSIGYLTVDIEEDESAKEYVLKLGARSMPLVEFVNEDGNKEHFTGFQPSRLEQLKK